MTAHLDASAAKLKRKIEARVGKIKADFATYIAQETDLFSDAAVVSIALLEMAIDRYIDLHGEQDARHLIESSIRRAVEKSKARLN